MCIFTTKFPKDECTFNTGSAIMTDKPEECIYDPLNMKFACFTCIHSSLQSEI